MTVLQQASSRRAQIIVVILFLFFVLLASQEIQMFILSWYQVGSQVTECNHVNLKPFCDKRPQIRQYINA